MSRRRKVVPFGTVPRGRHGWADHVPKAIGITVDVFVPDTDADEGITAALETGGAPMPSHTQVVIQRRQAP